MGTTRMMAQACSGWHPPRSYAPRTARLPPPCSWSSSHRSHSTPCRSKFGPVSSAMGNSAAQGGISWKDCPRRPNPTRFHLRLHVAEPHPPSSAHGTVAPNEAGAMRFQRRCAYRGEARSFKPSLQVSATPADERAPGGLFRHHVVE